MALELEKDVEEESGTGCRAVERNPIFFAVSVDTGLQSKLNVHFLPAAVARWWVCARLEGQTHTHLKTQLRRNHIVKLPQNAQIQNRH